MPLSGADHTDQNLKFLLIAAIIGALSSYWVQRRARMQLAAAHSAIVYPPPKLLARLLITGAAGDAVAKTIDPVAIRELARKFHGKYVAIEGIVTPSTPTSVLELTGLARFVQAVIYEKVINRHWTTYVPERREWGYSATNPLPKTLDLPSVSKDFHAIALSSSQLAQPLIGELAAGAASAVTGGAVAAPALSALSATIGTGLAAGRVSSGLETVERALRVGEKVTAMGYLDFYGSSARLGAMETALPLVEVLKPGPPDVSTPLSSVSAKSPMRPAVLSSSSASTPTPGITKHTTIKFPPLLLANPPSNLSTTLLPTRAKTAGAIAPPSPPSTYPHILVLSTLPDYIKALRQSFASWKWASQLLALAAVLLSGVMLGRIVSVNGSGGPRTISFQRRTVGGTTATGGSTQAGDGTLESDDPDGVEESYLLALAANLSGSILYYYLLSDTGLSIAVPVVNALAFVFTCLSGWFVLGERISGDENSYAAVNSRRVIRYLGLVPSMFHLYRDLLPPSVASCCVSGVLVSPDARNLAVARGNTLQIFEVRQEEETIPNFGATGGPGGTSDDAAAIEMEAGMAFGDLEDQQFRPSVSSALASQRRKVARLHHIHSCKLAGVIESMGVVRTAVGVGAAGMDSLLLGFADAKMSLVSWHPPTHSLSTLSLHFYEREEYRSEHLNPTHLHPEIRVDPRNRCVVFRVYGGRMAIVPVRQADEIRMAVDDDELYGARGSARKPKIASGEDEDDEMAPFHPSFVIPFSSIDPAMVNIIDVAFLHGYNTPTIVILYESHRTWTGRYPARRDTVHLMAVTLPLTPPNPNASLNPNHRPYPVLFSHDRLPTGSFRLHPLPQPLGGVLVLHPNGVVYVDQTTVPGIAAPVNFFWGSEERITNLANAAMAGGPGKKAAPLSYGPGSIPDDRPNPLYHGQCCKGGEDVGVDLSGAVVWDVDPDTVVLVTKKGEFVRVDLVGGEDSGRGWGRKKGGLRRIEVERCGVKLVGVPGCVARVGDVVPGAREGFVFLSNRLGDDVVFKFEEAQVELNEEEVEEVENDLVNGSLHGTKRRADDAFEEGDGSVNGKRMKFEDDMDSDLYGHSTDETNGTRGTMATAKTENRLQTIRRKLRFCATDQLSSIGPLRDCVVSIPTWWPSSFPEPIDDPAPPIYEPTFPRQDLELMCGTGGDLSGTLTILRKNIAPVVIASFQSADFRASKEPESAVTGDESDDGAIVDEEETKLEDVWKVVVSSDEYEQDESRLQPQKGFLFISRNNGTTVLDTSGGDLLEAKALGFHRSVRTVAAGSVLNGSLIVQITQGSVTALDITGRLVQELKISDLFADQIIVSADIVDPYVWVMSVDGNSLIMVAEDDHSGDAAEPGEQIVHAGKLNIVKELKAEFSSIKAFSIYMDPTKGRLLPTLREAEKRFTAISRLSEGGGFDDMTRLQQPPRSRQKPYDGRTLSSAPISELAGADGYLDELDRDLLYGGDEAGARVNGIATREVSDSNLYGMGKEDFLDDVRRMTGEHSGQDDPLSLKGKGRAAEGSVSVHAEITMENVSRMGVSPAGDANFWATILHENGTLEICRLPDMESCYLVPYFDLLPTVITDAPQLGSNTAAAGGAPISEVLLCHIGREGTEKDLYLLARAAGGDIAIYRGFYHLEAAGDIPAPSAFPSTLMTPGASSTNILSARATGSSSYDETIPDKAQNRLAIRFVRHHHDHNGRELRFFVDLDKLQTSPHDLNIQDPKDIRRRKLRKFNSLVGWDDSAIYEGVFVAGARPSIVLGMVNTSIPITSLDIDAAGLEIRSSKKANGNKLEDDLAHHTGSGMDHSVALDPQFVPLSIPSAISGKRNIRVHPMVVDGEILGFSEFDSATCKHGFVYVNSNGNLRIARLPSAHNLDADWPIRKIPLKRTPHHVMAHATSQTFVLATSTTVPFILSRAQYAAAVLAGVIEEGEQVNGQVPTADPLKPDTGMEGRPPGAFLPEDRQFQLELISPLTWETVDRYQFAEYEHILDAQTISLESKQTASGRKLFIVVGTGFVRAEDLSSRGKIYIFDVIEVVPEPDNPRTNHKLKLLYQSDDKGTAGPVTKLCGVNGYLLAAIGNKVIVHSFEDGESLDGVAFLDVNIYVRSVSAIKNVIVAGDIMKSLWFMGFQEEPAKLGSLGRDFSQLEVCATDFLIDHNQLSLLTADSEGNLLMFAFSPEDVRSIGGTKLLRRGEFHVGSQVLQMVRVRKMTLPRRKGGPAMASRQQAVIMTTADGGLCAMVPIPEKMYRRLTAVANRLVAGAQQIAGLNPRGFRRLRSTSASFLSSPSTVTRGANILDGNVIEMFNNLSIRRQREVSKSVGSSVDRVLDDLLELDLSVEWF
ncbi:Cleavage and polyadenylation specificity factor subunit 1 [Gonapodya sp. JEL0774]|nr:Cleavage and polyadenylation specificity factor subunit 1 [Gonapodya sp. JEL0774]